MMSISLFKTIYFNFHYLPFNIAKYLPIIIYKGVKLKDVKGIVTINNEVIRYGMIRIGYQSWGFQNKSDITIWEQKGGEVILGDNVKFGKGTFLSVGVYGKFLAENNVFIGGNSKIICWESISIGENTRFSWDITMIDTDFHESVNIQTGKRSLAKKPICIGGNNWIGFGCTILKGTHTPDFCIAGAKSFLNRDYTSCGDYILLANECACLKKQGIYRDLKSHVL